MQHGFIKAAAVTPHIKVADTIYNREQICQGYDEAVRRGAKIIVLPELCITGYTCGDLFLQERLLSEGRRSLAAIARHTIGNDAVMFVGLPLEVDHSLYNVAAAIQDGEVLAFIPKTYIPNYGEFYELRHFTPGPRQAQKVLFEGREVPFGTDILLEAEGMEGLKIGCEICEDLWAAETPGTAHALAGAVIVVNLSASDETVGKDAYREMLVQSASARMVAGYVYASAGEGESTQDLVFGAHNMIAENGMFLAKGKRFENQAVYGDIDINRLRMERRKMNTFMPEKRSGYIHVPIKIKIEETPLERSFPAFPFVPGDPAGRAARCEEILMIQALGLKKRLEHTGSKRVVLGISGGLDSTLALLAAAKTFDLLGKDRKDIYAITMPCFGTTGRTYDNACRLSGELGATLKEIDIREAVTVHFRDIGQDMEKQDVTYENSQARERTQVLMDIANQIGGMVVGTGDLSELALGFATYNGDHMSMYGVNAGVPKTLIRHLVGYYADTCGQDELAAVLRDVLDTPVSPELLPPSEGNISQITEDLVGPYELHDFFLYYMLRCGYEPAKIYRIALLTFQGRYEAEVIWKWLKLFYQRFFNAQFKRSCLPDGPKVGSVAVSPRGDLRMPSDACVRIWAEQLQDMDRS